VDKLSGLAAKLIPYLEIEEILVGIIQRPVKKYLDSC